MGKSGNPNMVKGGPSTNPSGFTKAEHEARIAMRDALAEPNRRARGLAAYDRLLEADNPVIVKDFMDRLCGKVKEHVTVEDENGKAVRLGSDWSFEQIMAGIKALRAAKGD